MKEMKSCSDVKCMIGRPCAVTLSHTCALGQSVRAVRRECEHLVASHSQASYVMYMYMCVYVRPGLI